MDSAIPFWWLFSNTRNAGYLRNTNNTGAAFPSASNNISTRTREKLEVAGTARIKTSKSKFEKQCDEASLLAVVGTASLKSLVDLYESNVAFSTRNLGGKSAVVSNSASSSDMILDIGEAKRKMQHTEIAVKQKHDARRKEQCLQRAEAYESYRRHLSKEVYSQREKIREKRESLKLKTKSYKKQTGPLRREQIAISGTDGNGAGFETHSCLNDRNTTLNRFRLGIPSRSHGDDKNKCLTVGKIDPASLFVTNTLMPGAVEETQPALYQDIYQYHSYRKHAYCDLDPHQRKGFVRGSTKSVPPHSRYFKGPVLRDCHPSDILMDKPKAPPASSEASEVHGLVGTASQNISLSPSFSTKKIDSSKEDARFGVLITRLADG